MCTVILGLGTHAEVPLWVAANRDEFYDRPSTPPAVSGPRGLPLFAPRDLRQGGTWIGVSRRGVFAALTNAAPPDRTPVPVVGFEGFLGERGAK